MAYEIAKLMLEHADSMLERQEAIERALELGMPIHEIEDYLDWLDRMRDGDMSDAGRSHNDDENS